MVCPNCGTEHDGNYCPRCGTPAQKGPPLRKKGKIKWWYIFAVIVIVGVVGSLIAGRSNQPAGTDLNQHLHSPSKSVGGESTPDNADSKTDVFAPGNDVAKPDANPKGETTGQRNALQSAKNYLSFSAFSRDGLIGQLEFEKYSNADAAYAADNCGADWKEQALKSAKNYLSFSAFSYQGLIEQLEFEKFTAEQATYGVENCGADWNAQAAKSAANYLNMMSFSRAELIDQLEFEGFTHEQAVYGAEASGY